MIQLPTFTVINKKKVMLTIQFKCKDLHPPAINTSSLLITSMSLEEYKLLSFSSNNRNINSPRIRVLIFQRLYTPVDRYQEHAISGGEGRYKNKKITKNYNMNFFNTYCELDYGELNMG